MTSGWLWQPSYNGANRDSSDCGESIDCFDTSTMIYSIDISVNCDCCNVSDIFVIIDSWINDMCFIVRSSDVSDSSSMMLNIFWLSLWYWV